MSSTRDELLAEARDAIQRAREKHQRWVIWQQIVDDWEAGFLSEEAALSTANDLAFRVMHELNSSAPEYVKYGNIVALLAGREPSPWNAAVSA